jgi:hypothetical protein
MMEGKQRTWRRRTALLASIAAVAFLTVNNSSSWRGLRRSLAFTANSEFHRMLSASVLLEDADEEDYDAAFAAAFQPTSLDNPKAPLSVKPYTLEDTLQESSVFEYTYATIIYDPPTDKFVGLYSKDHKWKSGNAKLWSSVKYLVYMLRQTFPERFCGVGCEEFAFGLGSGDYPHVRIPPLPREGKAPVLMFGSAFRDPNMYTTMIAMPMPQREHLYCFMNWVEVGGRYACKELRQDLPFGVEGSDGWDDLIPQVIWRGTDFSFLSSLQEKHHRLKTPDARSYGSTEIYGNKRDKAIKGLIDDYDELLPRWKAAALSAVAELQAHRHNRVQTDTNQVRLPWANMKMSSYPGAGKSRTVGSDRYAFWESVGIGVDNGLSRTELAKYKYHIDLGGGGGTTWSGTIEKLAMPGLLFHHVTPTKDYIHDRITAWRHYIPVRVDLKDLKAKFDWAESHPNEAKRIADEGVAFMRNLGTPEGFGQMFDEDFVEPLRKVIDAYQPLSSVHPGKSTWQEVLQSMGDDCRVLPVMECTGLDPYSCKHIDGVVEAWRNNGGTYKEA